VEPHSIDLLLNNFSLIESFLALWAAFLTDDSEQMKSIIWMMSHLVKEVEIFFELTAESDVTINDALLRAGLEAISISMYKVGWEYAKEGSESGAKNYEREI
jgi:hypothetical protein